MPSEPEKRIEPLLKAYAEKRRQAAAGQPEMHPANRRLLQSEVKQRWPARPDESPRWYHQLMALWPRLLTAGAIAVVLGFGLWYWGPSNQRSSTYLAKQESPPRLNKPSNETIHTSAGVRGEPGLDSQTDQLRLANRPADAKDAKKLAEATVELKLDQELKRPGAVGQPLPAAPAPPMQTKAKEVVPPATEPAPQGPPVAPLAVAPTPTEPPARSYAESLAAGNRPVGQAPQTASRGVVLTTPAPTPAPTATSPDPASRPVTVAAFTESASARKVYFRNLSVAPRAGGMAGATPELQRRRIDRLEDRLGTRDGSGILVNFAIEQRGPSLRIIDDDGSVYEGRVLTNAAPTIEAPTLEFDLGKQVALKREAPSPAKNSSSEPRVEGTSADKDAARPQAAFEVFGTNKSLRQSLSLAGTLYFSSTNALTETNIARFQQGLGAVTLNDRYATPEEAKVQANPAIPQVLRIRGLGRVNGSNEVPVDAIPAPR